MLFEPTSPRDPPPRRDIEIKIEPISPRDPPPTPIQIQDEYEEQDEEQDEESSCNSNDYYKPAIGIKFDIDSPVEYPTNIDYGTPLQIPKRNRIIVKKNKPKIVKLIEQEDLSIVSINISSEFSEV